MRDRRAGRISLSDTTPSPPPGYTNVAWQMDRLGNISGYVPGGGASLDIVVADGPSGPEIVFFQDADGNSHVVWVNGDSGG